MDDLLAEGVAPKPKNLDTASFKREDVPYSTFVIGGKAHQLASKYGLSITISGIPAMASYKFNSENFLKYKTLISQEMLKKGVLASTIFYACTEHKDEHINHYLFHLDEVFSKIAKCESEILDINNLLENPVCHAGFKRLN